MNDDTAPASPDRVIATATRSVLVLGTVCTVFGLTFVIALGVFNTYQRFRPWFVLMGLTLWLGPGLCYLAAAYFMLRHRRAAATAALATTAVQAVGAAALLVASATLDPVSPVPIVLGVMWLLALADCMRHLVRARRFFESETQRIRGFEVTIGPQPPTPLPVGDAVPPPTPR